MTEPSRNPFAPPRSDPNARLHLGEQEETLPPREQSLLPLWSWLTVSALTPFLAVPADPVSILITMEYGLASFCAGAVHGSSLSVGLRGGALGGWLLFTTTWVFQNRFHLSYLVLGVVAYGAFSVGMGKWASREIKIGRCRIISCFCVGYALGILLGAFGAIGGAGLGAVLARLSLRASDVTEDA